MRKSPSTRRSRSVVKAGADAIVLRRVRADSHLLRLAADHLRPADGRRCRALCRPLALRELRGLSAEPVEEYAQGAAQPPAPSGARPGNVAFELLAGGPEARQAIADAFSLKRRWMIQRGAVSTAFLDPATRDCLLDLAEDSAGSGAVVMRLMVNGEPAAIRFGFEYQRHLLRLYERL